MNSHLIEPVTPGTPRFRTSTLIALTFFGSLILPVVFVTGNYPPDEKVLGRDQVISIYLMGAAGGAVTIAVSYLMTVGGGLLKDQMTSNKNAGRTSQSNSDEQTGQRGS